MFVVTGVTGNTGKIVAESLFAAGKAVRVVVRDAKKGEPWKAKGAEVAIATFEDAAAIAAAFTGAEGVYAIVPPLGNQDTGVAAKRAAVVKSIGDAIAKARPKHVVQLSSVGAQHASGTGPIAETGALERAIRAAGVPATFLRAAYFMENWGPNVPSAVNDGALVGALTHDRKIPMIAAKDIGAEAARLLLEPATSGTRVVELAGPVEYSPDDTAALLGKLAKKTIVAKTIPVSALRDALVGMGFSAEVANLYAEMTDAINVGRVVWEGGSATAVRGKTTLEQVLAKLLS